MIKKILLFTITLNFIFVGCSKNITEEISKENKNKIETSYQPTIDKNTNFILSENTLSYSKFIVLGDLLFSPDPNNNNKLSANTISTDFNKIDKDSIKDIFDYNAISLTSDGANVYFSSITPEKGIYKLDYEKKEITKLNNEYSLELVYNDAKLYYLNPTNHNLYYYDFKDNKSYLLINSNITNFSFNNNSIFYINNNDKSKLYCFKIYEKSNFKLTDSSIESYAIFDDEILFSNSNDNNYIYSINSSNLEIKKVLNINASSLKQNESNVYFINNEKSNSLYKLIKNHDLNTFEYISVFDGFINDYYPTSEYIFIEPANDLNTIKYLNLN